MPRAVQLLIAGVAASLAAAPLSAQSALLERGMPGSAWLQLQRPTFDGGMSAWLLDGGIVMHVGQSSQIVARVPVVHVSEDMPSGASATLVGNPYLGVRTTTGATTLELGGRAPIISGSSTAIAPIAAGLVADFDQFEAYAPELATIAASVTSERAFPNGMVMRLHAGPSVMVPTHGGKTNVFADYSALAGYQNAVIEVDAGFTGRMLLTNAEGASLGERTVHQLALGATYRAPARIRPTLFIRVPLDQDLDALHSVVGMGFVIGLP